MRISNGTNGKINIAKLVLWNLCQPMHKRISADMLQAKVACGKYRGRLASLREQVRREVSAKLDDMQRKEKMLMDL